MKTAKCGCYFKDKTVFIVCNEHTYYEIYGDYNKSVEKMIDWLVEDE